MCAQLLMMDRLKAARLRRFVGREPELVLLEEALASSVWPFLVVHVFGPGGVGKSTLLHRWAAMAEERQCSVVWLDGRYIDPSPTGMDMALRGSLGMSKEDALWTYLSQRQDRWLLIVDTYEMISSLDYWFREVFIPRLPEGCLVVLSGRQSPSSDWRRDMGWQELLKMVPLRNLDSSESLQYLQMRHVSPSQQEVLLSFTHGHPLALCMAADACQQKPNTQFSPKDMPQLISSLLALFLDDVETQEQRMALEASALVRVMTEDLLSDMLQLPEVGELFQWLRELSFVDFAPTGLALQDLARDALKAHLNWRNPSAYALLHDRARQHYKQRVLSAPEHEQQRILADYVYLHLDNPVVKPFFDWKSMGGAWIEPAQRSDHAEILAMVRHHEGDESANIAAGWLTSNPDAFVVCRDGGSSLAGFLTFLPVSTPDAPLPVHDPLTEATRDYLAKHAPLRKGERATLFRFWMSREHYQQVSPIQSLIFVNMVKHYLTTPSLAYTFLPCDQPDFWAPVLQYADLHRISSCEITAGTHHIGTYGHDWRRVPPIAWLDLLAEREVNIHSAAPPSPPPPGESLLVLSRPDFEKALREALRCYTDSEALLDNPLLYSRTIHETVPAQATKQERIHALRKILQSTAEPFLQHPKQERWYRTLDRTYFHPAHSQEAAAEVLDLPFSTYRRHLAKGTTALLDLLWQNELGQ